MADRMSRWGVGPAFALISLAWMAVVIALRVLYPATFGMAVVPYWIRLGAGAILIVLGLPLWMIGVRTVMSAYREDRLCAHGVYRLCRHPVYGAWVALIGPGIALMIDSWLAISAPFVMYAIARAVIVREDAYLERRFGDTYREYKRRVPAILPLGPRRRV